MPEPHQRGRGPPLDDRRTRRAAPVRRPAMAAVRPALDVRRPHDREHQQQHGAVSVTAPARSKPAAAARRRSRGTMERRHQQDGGQDDRGEEHPPPVDRGEQPAGDQAESRTRRRRCRRRRAAPGPAAGPREARGDDRQAGRGHERGGDAGDEPGEDQHPALGGEPAEPGEGEEHDQPDDEHPTPAEQVGGAAAEQHETAVAEHVGADHPLQSAVDRPSSARIEGSATPIIETSMPSRKIAPHSTNSTPQLVRRQPW